MKLLLALILVIFSLGLVKSSNNFVYFGISSSSKGCYGNTDGPGYIFGESECANFADGSSWSVNVVSSGMINVNEYKGSGCQNLENTIKVKNNACVILPNFGGINANSTLKSETSISNSNSDYTQESIVENNYSDSKCKNYIYSTIYPNFYSVIVDDKNATYICDDNNAAIIDYCIGSDCKTDQIQSTCNTQDQSIYCTRG